jgi:hypothetical protein
LQTENDEYILSQDSNPSMTKVILGKNSSVICDNMRQITSGCDAIMPLVSSVSMMIAISVPELN